MELKINLKTLWSNNKVWVIAGALSVLSSAYYFSKDVVSDYLDRQAQTEYEAQLVKALENPKILQLICSDSNFVETLLKSPVVQANMVEFSRGIRKDVVKELIHGDSNKVSTREYLAAGANMHPDSVLSFQLYIFKMFKDNNITTKKDFKSLVETLEDQNIKTKPRRGRVPSF